MLGADSRPQIDRQLLADKADELDGSIQKLIAMRDGLRHAARCSAPSHMECPTFRRLLGLAASGVIGGHDEKSRRNKSDGLRKHRTEPTRQRGARHAGERVMASVTRWIEETLRLTVHPRKSAVDHPYRRTFLDFTVSRTGAKLKVSDKAIDKLKRQIRTLTRRTRGRPVWSISSQS